MTITIDSVRFRGLHVVDLNRLTKEQFELFGKNCYICQKKDPYNPVKLPDGEDLSMPEYILKIRDWNDKQFVAFYSSSDKGKEFEKQLAKYIKAFKKALKIKLSMPRLFYRSIKGEEINFSHEGKKSFNEYIEQFPGLPKACKRLYKLG